MSRKSDNAPSKYEDYRTQILSHMDQAVVHCCKNDVDSLEATNDSIRKLIDLLIVRAVKEAKELEKEMDCICRQFDDWKNSRYQMEAQQDSKLLEVQEENHHVSNNCNILFKTIETLLEMKTK